MNQALSPIHTAFSVALNSVLRLHFCSDAIYMKLIIYFDYFKITLSFISLCHYNTNITKSDAICVQNYKNPIQKFD